MNREELEEALKVVKEPIIVNSIEYKYFDIENYNKLVNVIEWCNYLSINVKPYVEAQDEEIERLNNIINEFEQWIKDSKMETFMGKGTINKIFFADELLDKIKELKGADKE